MLLHKSSISYVLENGHGRHRHDANNSRQQTSKTFKTASQEVEFLNAKSNAEILPANAGKERYNFYTGKSRDRWASGCKAYSSVTYKELYEGVDLKFYVDDNSLKYDLLLKKGSDPAQIKLKYHGQEMMTLEGGCAFASTPFGTITENAPVAYHVDEQHQKSVLPCKFILEDKVLSFSFPEGYDPEQRLVIDPELIFSTFSGAVSDNFGYTACFDDKGNLFSGGIIFGPDLSTGEVNGTYGGNYDMAILKYDSTGSDLLYATIIGGSNSEAPHSMIVNNNDELVILGTTGSDNFPISTNAYDSTFNGGNSFHIFEAYPDGSDIVLAKLGSSGNLVSSTFIGGPGNDGILKMNAVGNYLNQLIQNYGDYQRGDVIVDDEDNIYVASSTDSNGFPVSSAIQNTYQGGHSDAVAFSLNADLSQFRWGTYLGGTNDDAAYSIKINDQDQLLIGGGTLGAGFPTTAGTLHPAHRGEIDGFITKIDLAGDSLVQSTFLGTSAYDQVYMIDIDENQNVYAVGQTRGSYPVSNDVFAIPNSGQFIHKLTPDLSTTLFSTVFGSGTNEPNISPTAFLASQCGNLLLSGWGGVVNYTNSSNKGTTYGLPVTDNALFTETDGSDFYLMVLSSDGKELIYATFFGAENTTDGDHVDGGTSRFDKRGIIYQSVCSCGGSQDNFPTTPGAWSRVNRGISNGIGRCNNAAFKFDLASLRSKFQVNPPEGCAPLTVTFSNISNGGEEHLWMFGDGVTTQNRLHVEHTYEEAGTYNVSLLIKDNSTCIGEDISTQTIVVYDDQITVSPAVEICEGETVQLQATGGTSYEWNPPAGLNNRTLPNPLASPEESTTYTVSVITENGCEKEDVVPVTVIPAITKDLEVRRINNCDGAPQFSFTNNTDYDGSFTWDFGDGTTSEEQNPTHTYQREGEYTVNLDIQPLPECIIDKEITIDFQDLFIPNVFTPNNDNKNDFFEIRSDMELDLQVFNRKGKEVFSSDNYQNNWDGDGLRAGVYYYNLTLPNEDVCNGWVQILK